MQARNHENSDEICAQPVRHLDLATPAFYTYRKNPKCYHTVWGKNTTTPPHHRITTHTTTSPHHHNLAKHRIALVLGPDASTCLLSCRLKGRDTTDQNIFVISELLMRSITHHISSTYTHRPVRDMSVTGS